MADNNPNKRKIIVIPLHISLGFPCDYLDQTAKILAKNNLVILFDFRKPLSWRNILNGESLLQYISNVRKILSFKKGVIYFRPLSFPPFQSISSLIKANKKFGVMQ